MDFLFGKISITSLRRYPKPTGPHTAETQSSVCKQLDRDLQFEIITL